MLKYLLDTNIVIYTIKNRPMAVRRAFKKYSGQLAISAVTLGELVYGAEKSTQREKNLDDIDGLISRLKVLPFDQASAIQFGQLRAELARTGKPIGPYDQMIAGQARSQGLILVTNNMREFKRVPGLRVENWTN